MFIMIIYFEVLMVNNALTYLKVFYYVKLDDMVVFTDIIFQFYERYFKDILLNKNATSY